MKRSHIAIFNVPAPVHVHPTFSVVATLIRRGHRVSYVTSERFAPEFARYGADVLRIPRYEHPFNQRADESLPIEQQYAAGFFDLAIKTLRLASSFFERHRPDLILYDAYAIAGLIVAAKLHVPSVRITPQLAFDERNLEHPLITAPHAEALRRFKQRILEFFAEHATPPTDDIAFGREIPCIYFYARDLQLNNQDPEAPSIYAGRCAPERPVFGGLTNIPPPSRRAVLVSTSTAIVPSVDYYINCLRALDGLDWRVLVSVGNEIDAAAIGSLPPNAEIVKSTPQLMIMPHVDAMICLGGMTTTMEAMYHNLPMLMLTHGVREAEVYAQNNQEHGLGIHLSGADIGADIIKGAFSRLTSDARIRDQVRKMHKKVKRNPGSEEVVNWLEDYLSSLS